MKKWIHASEDFVVDYDLSKLDDAKMKKDIERFKKMELDDEADYYDREHGEGIYASSNLKRNNKIQEGLFWDIDGHDLTVISVSDDHKKCKIKEEWIAEDTGEEVEKTYTYSIGTDANGAEYAYKGQYSKFYANSAYNYPWFQDYADDYPHHYTDEGEDDYGSDYDEEYTSSTFGDYGPSNPWDAPGMSIHDFI